MTISTISTSPRVFFAIPAHKESLQRRVPDTHPEGWCLPCDVLHSHARPSERGPKLPNLGHGCLAPHPLRRRPSATRLYTVQHAAEGLKFLQPQSRGPRGQHTTDALAHAAGQHATCRWQILQAFIPRRWILAAPASFDIFQPRHLATAMEAHCS